MRFQPLSAGTYGSLDISRRFFTTLRALRIGACIKVSAAPFQTVHKLCTLVSQGAGGSALVMDYGADHAVGNSIIYSKVRQVLPNNDFSINCSLRPSRFTARAYEFIRLLWTGRPHRQCRLLLT